MNFNNHERIIVTMLVFKGRMSNDCKRYLIRQEMKSKIFSQVLFTIIVGAPASCAMAFYTSKVIGWVSYLVLASVIVFLVAMLISKNSKKPIDAPDIIIRDDGTMINNSAFISVKANINDVLDVVDMGNWYHIRIKNTEHTGCFICQKDLIVEGTLKDFENMFENKIVHSK